MKTLIFNKQICSIFFILFLFTGCTTFQISQDSLVKQLDKNQDVSIQKHFTPFTITEYPSNNLRKIKCINKNNEEVWLFPDKNTQFVIITKPDNKKYKIYYDTLILKGDTLYSLRSRIMKAPKVFPLKNISKTEVSAEFPRTERVKK